MVIDPTVAKVVSCGGQGLGVRVAFGLVWEEVDLRGNRVSGNPQVTSENCEKRKWTSVSINQRAR